MRMLPVLIGLLLPWLSPAAAQPHGMTGISATRLCRGAIDLAEKRHAIPARLLQSIGRVETGRRDPSTGEVHPWPWSINAEGDGATFDSKAAAIAAVRALQTKGVRSIDVGCMQVNLMHHPDAFMSLEQAFDPVANADYAARFLRRLFDEARTWPKAAGLYHSTTPDRADDYSRRVMAVWPEEQRRPGGGGPTALAAAWNATLPSLPGRIGGAPGAVTLRGPPTAGEAPTGKSLDAYRATPIAWAYTPPLPTPPAAPKGKPAASDPAKPWRFLRP